MHFLSFIPSFGNSLLLKNEEEVSPHHNTRSKELNLLLAREGRSVVAGHRTSKKTTDQIECVGNVVFRTGEWSFRRSWLEVCWPLAQKQDLWSTCNYCLSEAAAITDWLTFSSRVLVKKHKCSFGRGSYQC